MRRVPHFSLVALAAGCLLAAGPGGAVLETLAQCPHHAPMHAGHSGPQHHGAPTHGAPPGPCFCAHMMGGFAVDLPPAVVAAGVAHVIATSTITRHALPLPPTLVSTPPTPPRPPPPIVRA